MTPRAVPAWASALPACVLACVLGCGCGAAEAGVTGNPSAAACGACHATQVAAWSTSRLATSGTSPLFEALSTQAGAAWGEEARDRCVTCHQPGYGGDHGIGCVACHAATGNLADRDGLLTVDLTQPLAGPFDDPEPTPAHGSRADAFLTSPDLCGTCHELTGPGLVRETTLEEFQASPAAGLPRGCATCHMPALPPGPIAEGATASRARASHAFVGVDPPWGASADVAAAAAAGTLTLLRSGLQLVATRRGDGFEVAVENLAGHAVPTGIAFVRAVWVDVALTDANGARASLASVLSFGSQPTLEGTPVPLLTQADAVEDDILAAGATRTIRVDPPAGLVPPVRARVTLRARAVRPEVLDALGLSSRATEVPVHDVAVVDVP